MTYDSDKPLRANPTDGETWAYEREVERLLREAMVGRRFEVPRLILGVDVRGHYPAARVVVAFREDDGSEGEAEWDLWDPGAMLGGQWEAPNDVASSICSSWPRPDLVRITRPAPQPPDAEIG